MSSAKAHPQRETKIRKYVDTFKPGERFRASDVAKPLNLTPVEVGNVLKFIDTIRVVHHNPGAIWERIENV